MTSLSLMPSCPPPAAPPRRGDELAEASRRITALARDCAGTAAAARTTPVLAIALAAIAARLEEVAALLVPAALDQAIDAERAARSFDAGWAAALEVTRGRSRRLVADAAWLSAETAVTIERSQAARCRSRDACARLSLVRPDPAPAGAAPPAP